MQQDEEFDVNARKKAFEKATQELVQQARQISAHFTFTTQYDIGDAVKQIRNTFRDAGVRDSVLTSSLAKINFEDARYSEGFCVITSYVFANAFKPSNAPSPWQFMQFKDIPTFGTHVWLKFIPTGETLDLTFDQFTTFEGTRMNVPYHKGVPVVPKFDNPGLDKFIDSVSPEFAALVRRNIASK